MGPAVGAFPVLELALGPERLAGGAVFTLVGAFINITLVVKRFEDFLHRLLMVAVGRADKPVVRNVQQLPKLLDARNHLIYILLWGDAGSFCLLFDLLPMLVGTGEEIDAEEEAYFFKLSAFADRLVKLYEENPLFMEPQSRLNEMVNNFIKPGLEIASTPYRSTSTTGSTTLPLDLDILPPSSSSHPCP